MKKFIVLFGLLAFVLALTGCGKSEEQKQQEQQQQQKGSMGKYKGNNW